jgi:hypothetical protein
VKLKKGGAALVTFDVIPTPGGGVLQWFMTPDQLVSLARKR